MDAIEIIDLTKRYGERAVVDQLSFVVGAGTITGFLGANGAGKSTTLQMLLGLVRPTSGRATFFGRRYAELDAPATVVGALLDAGNVHPGRTGRHHLEAMALATGIPVRRVAEVLEAVDLASDADKKAGAYSLGMRQRLGLAGALLGRPDVLVLDEPANGLDPAGIRWLRSTLTGFAAQGGTVLLSSHQLGEVAEMVDDVVVVDHGRLVVGSSMEGLISRVAPKVRVRAARPSVLLAAVAGRGVPGDLRPDGDLVVEATPEWVGDLALEIGMPIYGLRAETTTLEDIFLELTEGSDRVDIAG